MDGDHRVLCVFRGQMMAYVVFGQNFLNLTAGESIDTQCQENTVTVRRRVEAEKLEGTLHRVNCFSQKQK